MSIPLKKPLLAVEKRRRGGVVRPTILDMSLELGNL
jgi:hypothetical protein